MIDLRNDNIPYFRELSDKQLKKIEKITKSYSCKNGDIVYLQGEFCQNWIVVNTGSFLTRIKNDDDVIQDESIILEGESFDFYSTINQSVTTRSLEALCDSSILVIDILGLKELAKKNPIIISLIKLSFCESESEIWNESILKVSRVVKSNHLKIKRCFLLSILKTFPVIVIYCVLILFVKFLFNPPRTYVLIFVFFIMTILSIVFYFLNSRLTYIELKREVVTKKQFIIHNMSLSNIAIPLDKIQSTRVEYKNRLLRLFKIGEIVIESAGDSLNLDGLFKPEQHIKNINIYKSSRINVDKAIELSSFKYLFCKQNGLFFLDSQMEKDDHSMFTFRKSIFYFLVRGIPQFIVFLASSVLLYKLFNNPNFLIINIPSILFLLWYFIDWRNDKYAFEGDKIIDIEKKPLFGKEKRIEAEINSIQSIKKEQKNFFEILFNIGDIEIVTFGGKIIYPSINNPDKVIDNLYLIKKYYYSKQESMDKLQRQEEFLNYTKYYQELKKS